MSNYQDPIYKSGSKWKIGDETYVVKGVWFISDDNEGKVNARTDKLVLQRVENGQYVGSEVMFTKAQLESKRPVKVV